MTGLGELWLVNLGAVLAPMVALWLVSVRLRDVSIVDMFWGTAFVIVAWATVAQTGAGSPRAWAIAGAVTIWGLRLSAYLLWRNWGEGEDRRYQKIRRGYGSSFWWKSLLIVFGFQGVLACVVSLPVQAGIPAAGDAFGPVHIAGVVAWAVGIAFESIGDWQLARFKADPANAGKVLRAGLWRYTRHPNYFGDFLVWWGLFGLSWIDAGHAWTAIGPAVMTVFLLRVSGVALLEKDIGRRRPDYASYVATTSAFFPWPPRRAS